MESYVLSSTLALMVGWAAALLFHGLASVALFGSLRGGDFESAGFFSFLFMMLANVFFIQLPKKRVSHISQLSSQFKFALISTVYALAVFTLLIGWLWIQAIYNDGNVCFGLLFYSEAAIIGLGFGICFPRFWKHPKT